MPPISEDNARWKRILIEGLVIVVSILLAFVIDAWWDRIQREAAEAEWIAAVQLDLRTSLGEIEETIGEAEEITGATLRLLDLLSSPSMPQVDSIRDLADRMTRPIGYAPALPGFESGFSEGWLSVTQSVEFRRHLADFRKSLAHFEESRRMDWNNYFAGPLYDVRAPYGGLQIFGGTQRERFRMSDEEYLAAMRTPEMFAAIETFGLAQENELRGLRGTRDAIEAMISSIEEAAR